MPHPAALSRTALPIRRIPQVCR